MLLWIYRLPIMIRVRFTYPMQDEKFQAFRNLKMEMTLLQMSIDIDFIGVL